MLKLIYKLIYYIQICLNYNLSLKDIYTKNDSLLHNVKIKQIKSKMLIFTKKNTQLQSSSLLIWSNEIETNSFAKKCATVEKKEKWTKISKFKQATNKNLTIQLKK